MYRGRYEGKHRKAAAPAHGKALRTGRLTTMVIATVLLLALAIGSATVEAQGRIGEELVEIISKM